MSKLSRTKGKNGELEFIKIIKEVYPLAARELSQYQETLGRDVKNTKPFCIQVKRNKARPAVEKALIEATKSTDLQYDIPVAAHRGDKGTWIISMYIGDWMDLIKGLMSWPKEGLK